jgi:phosphosulfolactate synthase (CoM biosynthesis protein A)
MGVPMLMVESEGITECVAGGQAGWRDDVVSALMAEVGPQRLMFEAADPEVRCLGRGEGGCRG